MCSACDAQITHNSIAKEYLNHMFQLPCVGLSQVPQRLQDNFPCSRLGQKEGFHRMVRAQIRELTFK